MNYMKTLGLATVAAAALMAFVGASTASGAVLCSTTTTPCGSKVPVGTKIGFKNNESILTKETGEFGETINTCKISVMTGELTKNSGTEGATIAITTLDWEECTWTTTTPAPGKLEVTGPITGTSNGTIVADAEVRVTVSIPFFGSCVFGPTAGTSLGTFTEGNPAIFDLNVVAIKLSGSSIICPPTFNLSGKYTVTEPANTTIAVEPN